MKRKERIRKRESKKEEGITLVALMITIIVLIILAAVTIKSVYDNAIIGKASNGTEEYAKEQKEEEKEISKVTYILEECQDRIIGRWKQTEEGVTDGTVTLKIGDEINYNHLSGIDTNNESVIKYKSMGAKTGHDSNSDGSITEADYQEFDITGYSGKWKVLGAENGKILITTEEPIKTVANAKYGLYGATGYQNGIEELDKISSKYAQGTYSAEGRSITVEDINRITGYDPTKTGVRKGQVGSGDPYAKGELNEYGNKVTYYWDGTSRPYYVSTGGARGKSA